MGCSNTKKKDAAVPSGARPAAGGSQGKLLEKYTLGKVLGQGAFGIVYSCKRKGTKEEFAVKMIDKVETPLAEIKQEAEMLHRLAHSCIVKLHDVYYEKAFVCMVMDIYRGGDMIEGMQLHWKTLGMLPISVIGNVSKQMIESIAWLHENRVVHRDVKGDNYLMDRKDIENSQCRIFLSDFGTVRELKDNERLNSKCGTKTYWAPEFFAMNYGLKVDVWAIGVVMYGLVTGRFPFKGEDDVKSKKVVIPPRSSKECGDILRKLLERKEGERLSAQQAMQHQFVATVRGPDKETPREKMDFKPDFKEFGANAAIADRRKELVGRLEEANLPGQEKHLTLRELNEKNAFQVSDKQMERVARFEWWPQAKATENSLLDIKGAKPAREDDIKSTTDACEKAIRQMFAEHSISTDAFGQGKAKKFEEFVYENQSGASRLMLDAEKHKSMVRVVDLVLLRLVCKTKDGKLFLVKITEKFPDGRVREDVNQLPGTKKEPHENSSLTVQRVLKERLHFTDCKIKFDFTTKEAYEESEDSPSYPGVRTVYRKEIFEGQISTSDPKVLERIGVTTRAPYTGQDSKGYTRTFVWLTDKEAEQKHVKLKAIQEPSDISALVHAPVGYGEEELKELLESNRIDVSKFGEGTNKSLKEFSDELVKGEAALVRQPNGRIIRVVDVVILKIMRGSDLLVETEEEVRGARKSLNWLPAVKRRSDENMFLAAHRFFSKVLKINDNFVNLNPTDVMIAEQESTSAAYCGLPTLYRKRVITGQLLPDEQFSFF
mmetsp:Transcript_93248/g.263625  ORF Transcript_93248/g.263625 Transcript_93248/m.263625 type:complete len:773 (+) Transcript_93248:81-2399(+)